MSLTAPRPTMSRDGQVFTRPVKAATVCLQGGLAILAAGYARPGRTGQGGDNPAKAADAATYVAVGIFLESVTGGVADGDQVVNIRAGCYPFKSAGGVDAITRANVKQRCFVVDDDTVALTSASQTRCVAGVIEDVDADGVWVTVGEAAGVPGRRTLNIPFAINETDTLAGTSAELVSPVAGRISGLTTIVQKAVTTGGDVTAAVGVTAVAGLACTIADAATKGTVVSDTPTAGDASTVVKPGDRIQVIPGAPFNTAGAVSGFVEISY